MSNSHYPAEFKIQAVNQVTEKKLPVADVAARLGVMRSDSTSWVKVLRKIEVTFVFTQAVAL